MLVRPAFATEFTELNSNRNCIQQLGSKIELLGDVRFGSQAAIHADNT